MSDLAVSVLLSFVVSLAVTFGLLRPQRARQSKPLIPAAPLDLGSDHWWSFSLGVMQGWGFTVAIEVREAFCSIKLWNPGTETSADASFFVAGPNRHDVMRRAYRYAADFDLRTIGSYWDAESGTWRKGSPPKDAPNQTKTSQESDE